MAFTPYLIQNDKIKQLKKEEFNLEKELQKLIEENLVGLFRLSFLAIEYSTGERHEGRMLGGKNHKFCPYAGGNQL